MINGLNGHWKKYLSEEFDKKYMNDLDDFLKLRYSQNVSILPDKKDFFKALEITPLEKVKVVILGQDPYPNKKYTHGLCFSVLPDVEVLPKSLVNIHKEILDDLGIDNSNLGYLQSWGKQGVLLLNSVLSIEEGKTFSHKNKGWEIFTDKIIHILNEKCENLVFILWGNHAKNKCKNIDLNKHFIISSSHPSPLSAYRSFFKSKCFSKCNEYLISNNIKPIDWSL
jgi:uracil-DNA glycosylase